MPSSGGPGTFNWGGSGTSDPPGFVPSGAVGPYTPGATPPPPAPIPEPPSPLNAQLGGGKILWADDIAVPDPNDNSKSIPGKFTRILHFEDGTIKRYEYSVIDYPENATGAVKDWVPKGAVYLGDRVDPAQQTSDQNRQALARQNQQQDVTQSQNVASQSGYVTVPGPDGNPMQTVGPDGKPVPTLAREGLDRQAAADASANSRADATNNRQAAASEAANALARDRGVAQDAYNNAQLEATRERDRIQAQVANGTLDATKAKNEFDRWMEMNVNIPFKQMEEARARATEARLAQQAEDKRRNDAASYEMERQKTAIGVGTDMVKQTVATMPYMAGPNWGSQYAGALNAVAKGRPQDIKFDASGLTFKGPDFEKIAEDATRRAVAHMMSYPDAIASAGDRPGGGYTNPDYSGIQQPGSVAPAGGGMPTTLAAGPQLPQGQIEEWQ